MRIDAHQHFWHYSPVDHAWMSDAMAAIQRDFLPGDLEPLLKSAGFDGCVAVQARQSLEETRWLLELAEKNAWIKGVVGWVDLRSPQLTEQLERFAKHPKLVGVRHVVHDEPDDNFMLGEAFRNGIAQLQAYGLTYDLLLFPKHLPVAAKLVAEFPEQPFVLDHIAKPLIAEGVLAPWSEDIRAVAKFPNVLCKLSGMVTEAKWNTWAPEDFRPYLGVALEAFGAERLMIGSDWPVCKVSGSYAATMQIVRDFIRTLTTEERDAILGGNCARFYGID